MPSRRVWSAMHHSGAHRHACWHFVVQQPPDFGTQCGGDIGIQRFVGVAGGAVDAARQVAFEDVEAVDKLVSIAG